MQRMHGALNMPFRILIKIRFFLGTCGIFRRIKRHEKPGGQHAVAIMLRHGVPAFRIFVPRIRALRVLQTAVCTAVQQTGACRFIATFA